MGVFTNYSGSSDFYIADSVFLGRDDPTHLTGWNGEFWQQFEGVDGQEFPPVMKSYTGDPAVRPGPRRRVQLRRRLPRRHRHRDLRQSRTGRTRTRGPRIRRASSGIAGRSAIDFYNNYITNLHDNAIEMDGSMHNIRVMRNMMINSASHPMCNQPSVGGPVYWIRNIVYHAPGGSTRMTSGSAGVLFYNNTILTETCAGRRRTCTGATT